MTPGSFLTMSGAAVLVAFSVYDLWLERVVVEVGRRRQSQDPIDLSSDSPAVARLQKFGVTPPPRAEMQAKVVCSQATGFVDNRSDDLLTHQLTDLSGDADLLDDLSAFHAWVMEGHAGFPVRRIVRRHVSGPLGGEPAAAARVGSS